MQCSPLRPASVPSCTSSPSGPRAPRVGWPCRDTLLTGTWRAEGALPGGLGEAPRGRGHGKRRPRPSNCSCGNQRQRQPGEGLQSRLQVSRYLTPVGLGVLGDAGTPAPPAHSGGEARGGCSRRWHRHTCLRSCPPPALALREQRATPWRARPRALTTDHPSSSRGGWCKPGSQATSPAHL